MIVKQLVFVFELVDTKCIKVPIQVSEPTGDSRRVIDNRLKQR